MELAVILLIASVNLLVLGGMVATVRHYRRLKTGFIEFISPTKDAASPLFQVSDVISQQLAQHITASIKGTFMQANSVAARNEKKLTQAVATDAIGMKSPWLAALTNLPAVQGLMESNPGVVNTLLGMLLRGSPGGKSNGHEPEAEIVSLTEF